MRLLLQALSLSDRYERKSRLLPGLVAASPLIFTMAAVVVFILPWYTTAGVTVGGELLLAFLLGYLARVRGKAAEEAMWRAWGGPPTTRWLRPTDTTCSEEQKSRWRGVLYRITGLKIPASLTAERTEADIDRVIADAIRQLRYSLRERSEAAMVRQHNEEYGFARNLLGLRWHWIGLAVVSLLGCVVMLFFGEKPYLGFAVSGGSLLLGLLIGQQLPDHVRRCADRYAESLFAAAVLVDDADAEPTTAA